jgi:DNA-binding protein Fis
MTIELERLLNSESLARLREEAERRHAPIDGLVRDALENYIAALDEQDGDESSDAALAERFQTGLQELINGKGIPAEESLARLRAKHSGK